MKNFIHHILKSKGIIDILTLSSGNIIGTVISALAILLFSRHLGPSEFGIFSVSLAVIQITVRIADFGINIAAERSIARIFKSNLEKAQQYIIVTLWLKFILAIVVTAICLMLSNYIAVEFLHINNPNIIIYAFLFSIGTVVFEFVGIVLQASQQFNLVSRMTIFQAIGKLIVGMVLIVLNGLSALSALIIYALSPLLGAVLVWPYNQIPKYSLPKAWKKIAINIIKVTKWTSIAALSATLAENIDTLIIQSLLTPHETGLWSAAIRIASFVNILGWSMGTVLNNRVANYHNKKDLDLYLSKAKIMGLISIIFILLLIPLSKIGLLISVGSQYLDAHSTLNLLLVSTSLSVAVTPFVALFYLFDRPSYYAFSGIIQTVLLLLGDYILIPLFGISGAAWSRVVVRVIILIFTLIYAKYTYKSIYNTVSS